MAKAKVLEQLSLAELEAELQVLSVQRTELVQRSRYVQELINKKLAQAKIDALGTSEKAALIAALGIPSAEAVGVPGG